MTQPTAQQIATRAQEFKIAYLGMTMTLPLMFDPGLPVLRWHEQALGPGPIPIELLPTGAGPQTPRLVFDTEHVLRALSTLRGEIVFQDLMSVAMMQGATRLGYMIEAAQLYSSDPLLQFTRHFRNACAHGDRWHFRSGEPRRPATCRSVTLDASMHGTRACWETVHPLLYVQLLDDIANHFVPGSVPRPPVDPSVIGPLGPDLS